jgi:predicted nucleic acid-binding Zn ribbon protein
LQECATLRHFTAAARDFECRGEFMEKAGDLLGRVARKLGHRDAALIWLSGAWPQIVGKTLAAHTCPVRCEGGCLEVAADAKTWQKQLDEMRRDFCARVNHSWGSTLVREVRFVVPKRGSMRSSSASANGTEGDATSRVHSRRLPYELDNDHTPFIRSRKP